ncbi:MAG: hypothetical protein R2877_03750 [Bdellovibrionota bacterium]
MDQLYSLEKKKKKAHWPDRQVRFFLIRQLTKSYGFAVLVESAESLIVVFVTLFATQQPEPLLAAAEMFCSWIEDLAQNFGIRATQKIGEACQVFLPPLPGKFLLKNVIVHFNKHFGFFFDFGPNRQLYSWMFQKKIPKVCTGMFRWLLQQVLG